VHIVNTQYCLGLQLPPDCRVAAVFVAGLSLNGTFCEPVFCQQFAFAYPHFQFVIACLSVNPIADDGESDEQVVLVSQSGTVNRIKVGDISVQSRAAK
jgi:DNA gyrase subunit A